MLTLLLAGALALGPAQAYDAGNRAYAAKDYAKAAESYREALAAGHDARAHYNLGNALFKSGRIGEAVVNWRRAAYLAPRDQDIAANLAFARGYRVDKLPAQGNPLGQAADRALHALSDRESTLLAAFATLLAALALGAWIVWRRTATAAAAALAALVAVYGLATRAAWSAERDGRPAVVVVPEASANSGPGEESKQILLMHDGTEVQVRESRGDWLLVQLPGGAGGWVRRNTLERVY